MALVHKHQYLVNLVDKEAIFLCFDNASPLHERDMLKNLSNQKFIELEANDKYENVH